MMGYYIYHNRDAEWFIIWDMDLTAEQQGLKLNVAWVTEERNTNDNQLLNQAI